MTPTPASQTALLNLRVFSNYEWYIIPILVIVMYIWAAEVQKAQKTKNWNVVFAGLTVFGMDLINEIWNALVFHFTQYSAFWTTPERSTFVIMIGWNLEIALMFSIAGLVFGKFLPEDKKKKVLGIPNRWLFAAFFAAFAVFVEILLNISGALVWEYPWWNATPWGVPLIFLFGYFHFFVGAFIVYDMKKIKNKIKTVAIIYAIGLLAVLIFMFIPTWIGAEPWI
ncbi:MAG: hypothetical protein ACFFG0_50055 [Candidatus Thorarchaeota archaeon]